jgi:flagellar biosynthesis chaperone FliJ
MPVHVEAVYKVSGAFLWERIEEPITVVLSLGEKRAKLGGLKKFTSYTITLPNGAAVERRYKHFDWLHSRLKEKFPLLTLPSPPEKQFSGRFEHQFLESRRRQLEQYLNYCGRHPVLRASSTLHFFLEETKDWKPGKRACEKDSKETGDKFTRFVDISAVASSNWTQNADKIADFRKYLVKYDRQLSALTEADAHSLQRRSQLAPELEKEAERWSALQERVCWQQIDCPDCAHLSVVYGKVRDARLAERDGHKAEELPTYVSDVTKAYSQFMQCFSESIKHRDSTESQLTAATDRHAVMHAAAQKASQEVKSDQQGVEEMRALYEQSRKVEGLKEAFQVTTVTVLAEMGTLHNCRLTDMRENILALATRERDFYRLMAEKWDAVVQAAGKIPTPQ